MYGYSIIFIGCQLVKKHHNNYYIIYILTNKVFIAIIISLICSQNTLIGL